MRARAQSSGSRCRGRAASPAACGNSASSKPATTATTTAGRHGVTEVTARPTSRRTCRSRRPGVTDNEIGVAVITSKTNILGGHVRRVRRRHQGVLRLVSQRAGRRDLRPQAQDHQANRDDQFSNNQQTVQGEPRAGQGVRDVHRDAAVHRRPDLARRQAADVHLEHQPRVGRAHNIFGNDRRALLQLRRPGPAVPRASSSASRRSASSRTASTAVVEGLRRARQERASRSIPSAKVVFFDDNTAFAQPDLSARSSADEEEGRAVRRDLHRHRTSRSARQGDEAAGPERGAGRSRTRYDQEFVARERAVPRRRRRRAAVRAVRERAADPRARSCSRSGSAEDRQARSASSRPRVGSRPTSSCTG